MGILSSISKAVSNAAKAISSSGSSGSRSSSSGSSSGGSYSSGSNYKQDMSNYLANGGKTTDAAYQNMNSNRYDKIMGTDWQAKIDAATNPNDKKWMTDVRNEKLALMGKDKEGIGYSINPNTAFANVSDEQYQQYVDPYANYDIQNQMNSLAEARRQSQIAGLSKARDNALAGLDTQKAAIEPYYYNAKNQAAARSDVGAMNFAQYMAGRGVQGSAGAMPEMYRNAGLQSQIGALDQQQSSELAGIERNKANINSNYESDIAAANADIEAQKLSDYITQMNADREYKSQQDALNRELLSNNQNQYVSTIGAYGNDYQAEIDKLRAQGATEDDYRIKALMAARNEKIANQQSSQSESDQQDFENQLALQRLALTQAQTNYNIGKPYYAPKTAKTSSSTKKYTPSQIQSMYENGWISESTARQMLGI